MFFALATSVVAFVVYVATVPQVAGQRAGRAVPIAKRSQLVNADGTVDFAAFDGHLASVEGKVLRGLEAFKKNTGSRYPSAKKGLRKRGYGDALTNYKEAVWYGDIAVGTPPASFSVVFDTGSSDLFLSTSLCDTSCSGHDLWDPNSSSSAEDVGYQLELTFGGGAVVWVELYTETVSIGSFTATSQTLGAATSISSAFQSSQFPPDGVMGMGFQSLSVSNTSPYFQTLVSEGQAPDSIFSFQLSPSGGELYIGGSNPDLYAGDFSYVPVMKQGFWQVTMDDLEGNGQTLLSNVDAIIDTGTTFVVGPPSDVSSLYSTLGGTPASFGQGYYTFPCDSFPNVSLSFGGTSFPILSSALNVGRVSSGSSDCVSGIVGQDVGYSFWVIGDVFLEGVYTAFDVGNARVGFAQLAGSAASS